MNLFNHYQIVGLLCMLSSIITGIITYFLPGTADSLDLYLVKGPIYGFVFVAGLSIFMIYSPAPSALPAALIGLVRRMKSENETKDENV